MKKQVNIIITGRVQGVHFRASAKKQADKLKLTGWARNTQEGTVEITAQGNKKDILDFINWCYEGSSLSSVQSVYVDWCKIEEKFDDFQVIRSDDGFVHDQFLAYRNFAKNIFGKFLGQEENEDKLTDHMQRPNHVVIIPDGNRRWAKEQGWKVWKGHEAGRKNTEVVLDALKEEGVKYVTLWGFSTENWKRSSEEIEQLMKIFENFIGELLEKSHKEKIKCVHLGRKDRLPESLLQKFQNLEEETNDYSDFHIGIALDYGGRDEIIRAMKNLVENKQEITEENFSQMLDTKYFPDPDLIIRTSGEKRLSGMMPWQGIYAEIAFVEKYFPALNKHDIQQILVDYAQRKRRYGK